MIALIISIFIFASYSKDVGITGMAFTDVTGNVIKITGRATNLNIEEPEDDLQLSWESFNNLQILGNIGADQDQYHYYVAKQEYEDNPDQYHILRVGDKEDSI